MTPAKRLPTVFIPHGGGPCFFMKPQDFPPNMPQNFWTPMGDFLRGVGADIGRRPKAILCISAHWLTPQLTIGNAPKHSLFYDYGGFPPYTYKLTYPAMGDPALAQRVADLLGAAGFASKMDDKRGLDHGVFIPFKLIYPDADIPIVPLSLRQDLDPAAHIAIGAALAPLRDEDVLIIGTGMSFHNIRALMMQTHGRQSQEFDDWLGAASCAPAGERNKALSNWLAAPSARAAHPEEEHLLPLMVAAGAAGADQGRQTYRDKVGNIAVSAYAFG